MNCNQCQEVQKNGCRVIGTCGKVEELDFIYKGLRNFLMDLAKDTNSGVYSDIDEIDKYITDMLFLQITNVNFDLNDVKRYLETEGSSLVGRSVSYTEELKKGGFNTDDEDINSLKETIYYGLMGLSAYMHHANNLGYKSKEINVFVRKALEALLASDKDLNYYVELMLETGKYSVEVMKLLDEANTTKFGNPEISEVNIGVGNNPAILISGHDMNDIKQLLEQTEGLGIDVYTHSEMLSAHYYPELKKYEHLVGNYGNAWYDQVDTFETFNGPIIFTTNCLVPPKKNASYNDRVFTTGVTGMEGWKKITIDENGKKDFSPVIELAKQCDAPTQIESGTIVGGFAHNQVLALAETVIEKVREGKISKFVVMAGCDGRQSSRKYYTEFASSLPKSTIILTAGCAKYRYNKLNLGDIDGIPRVLDAGQCNDSYSLAVIALKLAEVFECDVNELPIAYNIAWYEQKAITVFLALLFLGVKNIKVGPTLPAFLSPNIVNFLVENYNVSTITTVEQDLNDLIYN
ncbi:MAG: hydroxylamine reductase [Bacilli bacterium]